MRIPDLFMRILFTISCFFTVLLTQAQTDLKRLQFQGEQDVIDSPGDFAELSDGTIVLLWTSYHKPGMDTCFVNARKIPVKGGAGPIIHLDTFPVPKNTIYTIRPVVFPDNKSFGFAFALPLGSLSAYQLYFDRFSLDGKPLVQRLRVDTLSYGAALYPSVAVNKNGNFVVAWEQVQNGVNAAMFRVFNKQNQPVTAPVSADPCGNCYKSSVQVDFRYGKIAMTWKKTDEIAALRITYRVFSEKGIPLCEATNADPKANTGLVTYPRIRIVSKKSFALVWSGRLYYPEEAEMNGIKDSAKLYLGFYGFDGKPQGDFMKVNTSCCKDLSASEISVRKDSLYITWSGGSPNLPASIYAWKISLKKKKASLEVVEAFEKQGMYRMGVCRATKAYRYFVFNNGKAAGAAHDTTLGYAFTEKKPKAKKEKHRKEKGKKKKEDEKKEEPKKDGQR